MLLQPLNCPTFCLEFSLLATPSLQCRFPFSVALRSLQDKPAGSMAVIPGRPLTAVFGKLCLSSLVFILDAIVDSHALVGNDTERFLVPFSCFSPGQYLAKL